MLQVETEIVHECTNSFGGIMIANHIENVGDNPTDDSLCGGADGFFEKMFLEEAWRVAKKDLKMTRKSFAEKVFCDYGANAARIMSAAMGKTPSGKPRRMSLREAYRAAKVIGREFSKFSWEIEIKAEAKARSMRGLS